MELRIQHTWDGALLEESEHAVLRLTWSPEVLEIAVDAPFAGDPAPPGDGGATWQLWDYEVVELFLVGREEREQHGFVRFNKLLLLPWYP